MRPVEEMSPEGSATNSPWGERVLMGAVIVTMLLSLIGYMRG